MANTRFPIFKSMWIFSDAQGQLTLQSVVGFGRISNFSELSCTLSLPVRMKKIGLNSLRKNGNINYLDSQGQLTLRSVVGSGQILNSSKLVCMSS